MPSPVLMADEVSSTRATPTGVPEAPMGVTVAPVTGLPFSVRLIVEGLTGSVAGTWVVTLTAGKAVVSTVRTATASPAATAGAPPQTRGDGAANKTAAPAQRPPH